MNLDNVLVGIDIESIPRFRKLKRKRNKQFLANIFTERELEYCYSTDEPARHLAARFAAKEAFIKASAEHGKGATRFYNQIEVLNKKSGMPYIKCKDRKIKISLSHCDDKAIALVMMEKSNGSY